MGFKRIRRKPFAIQVVERFNNKYETPRRILDYDGPTFSKNVALHCKGASRNAVTGIQGNRVHLAAMMSVSVWKHQAPISPLALGMALSHYRWGTSVGCWDEDDMSGTKIRGNPLSQGGPSVLTQG